ncbi:MAG: hypothetical protein N3G22_01300 [Candidatus Micrarchaeota archaeon]|nr:hypothetical protein [Candidatus Micrarchaeota archaeon]
MAKIRRVAIVANEKKPIARQVKKAVAQFLVQHNIRPAAKPQLVITVGGDGTVLFSKKYYGVPFFAIGSSTSFICQATFRDWKEKLSRAISSLEAERRLLLEGRIGKKRLPLALNEVGVRSREPRMVSIYLRANGKEFAFRADGIIFSTPTGSPAYCYSCGGRQMKRADSCFQAVAIAPFRRAFSPTVLGKSTVCEVMTSASKQPDVFVDGQVVGRLANGEKLTVKASKKGFYFAKI